LWPGLSPPTPLGLAPSFNNRGRQDKPGDDTQR
jgi:hypothetical protein